MTQKPQITLIELTMLLVFSGACTSNTGNVAEDTTATDAFQEQLTIWTDQVELFYHHSPLVAGVEGQAWAVHLTDLATFTPIDDAVVRMQFFGPTGEFETVVQAPDRPGLYTPEPTFPEGGAYDLSVWVDRDGEAHEVFVGPIIVYASEADVPQLEAEPAVGITFQKEQQWAIPFATAEAVHRDIPQSIEAIGEVIPASGRHAAVAAPVAGIIQAAAGRQGPVPGQWVNAGEVLTELSPANDAAGYAELVGRYRHLEREVARAERLYAIEAIPERRLIELRHDFEVAEASLDAMGGASAEGFDLALKAPISGVVNERNVIAGARVSAGDLLFSIIDTRRVWVRMDVASLDAVYASQATGATFVIEGGDAARRADRLVSIGRVINPDSRTLPVLFEAANDDQRLRIGMLVHGRVLLGDPVTGVAIPTAAVREEDGLFVAYVHIGGESFERRALTLGPTDGEWTIIENGVREGERVVTLGAYQVKLSSLNTNAISDHGHPH